MNLELLLSQIQKKQSFLCVGLDVDLDKIPAHLLGEEDPIFAFNKAIIDATHSYAVAYKPNIAFYEAYGVKGWQALAKTVDYINLSMKTSLRLLTPNEEILEILLLVMQRLFLRI